MEIRRRTVESVTFERVLNITDEFCNDCDAYLREIIMNPEDMPQITPEIIKQCWFCEDIGEIKLKIKGWNYDKNGEVYLRSLESAISDMIDNALWDADADLVDYGDLFDSETEFVEE